MNSCQQNDESSINFILFVFSGVLSVVLVVGDTWCAVTDPLRYHSRISYLKSWCLIGTVWIISILFSATSAFRSKWCIVELESNEEEHMYSSKTASLTGSNDSILIANIYALVFSCVYFTLIILIPFAVVCIMYWKIFSEARQSGLRMRRNGSSPLLQSSLNLHNTGMNATSLTENQRYPSLFDVSGADAITMKIDSKQYAIEDGQLKSIEKRKLSTPTVATHQYRRYLDIPENEEQTQSDFIQRERTKSEKSLNGFKPKLSQFRRNFSARHLVDQPSDVYQASTLFSKSCNLSRILTGEMRQVHSSPNLQKLSNLDLLQKMSYSVNDRSTTSINQASQQPQNSPRALSYMISIRHRLSNASSIFKYREESRAARIGIVVVAMFMISYLPYGLMILLQGRITFIPNASLCSILVLLIANISSPFIFAYRNRRIRRAVCRLFGVDTKPNSYLQKQRMQLKNSQSTNGNAKHVRIHRNLSASNFSLNMLPYKLAASSMLPIQSAKIDENALSYSNGSVLVPIDDVEIESNENTISCINSIDGIENRAKKVISNDVNNNRAANQLDNEDSTKVHKEKMSIFQRMRSNVSRKSVSCDDNEIVDQTIESKHNTEDNVV